MQNKIVVCSSYVIQVLFDVFRKGEIDDFGI